MNLRQGPCRALVIKLRQFGDVLLSTPVFTALKQHNPAMEVFAVVNPGTEQVLADNPDLTGVLIAPRAEGSSLGRWKRDLRFIREVRRKHFDLVIDLTTSDRSAILTRLSGAPRRLGYRSFKGFLGRQRFYTETVQAKKHEHIILKHLRMLAPLGISQSDPRLVFVVTDSAREAVKPLLPKNREFFQLHPVSRIAKKNWPVKYLAETVNWVASRGFLPVITGSADAAEQAWIHELGKCLSCEFVDLSGKLTFQQLGAVSESAKFFLGVDTAPMHIAAAVGTPVVAIFGPTSERMWSPWCDTKLIVSREDLDCRPPCQNKHHCEHIACLREMGPERVIPKIEAFLTRTLIPIAETKI